VVATFIESVVVIVLPSGESNKTKVTYTVFLGDAPDVTCSPCYNVLNRKS
jgi:hypothetical protein